MPHYQLTSLGISRILGEKKFSNVCGLGITFIQEFGFCLRGRTLGLLNRLLLDIKYREKITGNIWGFSWIILCTGLPDLGHSLQVRHVSVLIT